jgi:hypothetical protein
VSRHLRVLSACGQRRAQTASRRDNHTRALQLPTGGGAWIGTPEFADAAGFAAAQSYGGMAGPGTGISGTADQAIWAHTLIKVVWRDVRIGIWAFELAIVSVTRWQKSESCRKVEVGQIWWRFPKFVIGFLVAFRLDRPSDSTCFPWFVVFVIPV